MLVGLRYLTASGTERKVQSREDWDAAWDDIQSSRSSSFHFTADRHSSSQPPTPGLTTPTYRTTFSVSPPPSSPTSPTHLRTKSAPLPSYVPQRKSLRGRPIRLVLAGLAVVVLLYVTSHVTRFHYLISALTEHTVEEATPVPLSCETCVANPDDPLCSYGVDNVRLSRMYEGSGYRVRKVIEKALSGERVSIGIIGASVTAGHGIEGYLKWQEVFLNDWMEQFPNTTVYDGSAPGMNSEFYSYCFESYVPPTADMYLVELDINNDKYAAPPFTRSLDRVLTREQSAEYTVKSDDSLYRGLLQLPQEPAVVRVSVLALSFWELTRGTASGLIVSEYFDVPVIGIRNVFLPHLLLHPNDTDIYFHLPPDGPDLRHISHVGHRAMGDLLSIYMRDQVCKARQRLELSPLLPAKMWPSEDILGMIPDQYLWTPWERDSHITPIHPSCSIVGNSWNPIKPLPNTSPFWEEVEWNGKAAVASHRVGARIELPFSGTRVGIFVWSSGGEGYKIKPGRAICFVDGFRAVGTIVDAWHDWKYATSRWRLLKEDLAPGNHVLTCEILKASSTSGHDFRILGVGSQ